METSQPSETVNQVTDEMVHAYSAAYDKNYEAQRHLPDEAPGQGTFYAMRAGLEAALALLPKKATD